MKDPNQASTAATPAPADAPAPPPKVVSAQQLFDGTREICINHDGDLYRLRITRRGKLILQK